MSHEHRLSDLRRFHLPTIDFQLFHLAVRFREGEKNLRNDEEGVYKSLFGGWNHLPSDR